MGRRGVKLAALVLVAAVLPISAASSTQTAEQTVPGSGSPPIAVAVYEHLRSEYEIGIAAPASSVTPELTSNEAVSAADGFGGWAGSTHLVLYTDFANAPDEQRLAWLVVFRDATIPSFGPPGRDHRDTVQTVAAFVDAASGEDFDDVTLP